jgi:hypothetical protein
MFKEKLLRKIENTMNSYMRDRYYWFDHLEIEFDPQGSRVLRQNEPLITYIVYFKGGDYDFRETWENGDRNLDKGNDTQQSAQEYISKMHGSIFKFEDQRIYFTSYSFLPNGDRVSFPFISYEMRKKSINESTSKTDKYVEYVFRQVVREIKLIYKGIGTGGLGCPVYMQPSDNTKIAGMQVPGVNYEEDDYHFFSYFSDDLFDRKKNSDDYEFDHLDDQEFYEHLRDKYGFPKELLPQLQKKLERWAKETDPDYNKPITESEDKLEKYYNYVVNDIISRLEFNDPIFDHMAELYGKRVNTCNLRASIDEIIKEYYGAKGIDILEIVVKVKQRLDKIRPHRCDPDYRG